MGGLFLKAALSSWKKETDASEFGGVQLLGVDGAVIIGHGGSTAKAIRNAIKSASQSVELEVNNHIIDEIKKREQNNNTHHTE